MQRVLNLPLVWSLDSHCNTSFVAAATSFEDTDFFEAPSRACNAQVWASISCDRLKKEGEGEEGGFLVPGKVFLVFPRDSFMFPNSYLLKPMGNFLPSVARQCLDQRDPVQSFLQRPALRKEECAPIPANHNWAGCGTRNYQL